VNRAPSFFDEVHVRHRHTVGARNCHALVHEPTDCFTGLWSCDDPAVRHLRHGGDGIEGRIDDQLRPEIGVDMLRDATWNVSNHFATRAIAASRAGPERPGKSPMTRSPRPACVTRPGAGIELATYTTAAIGSNAAAALMRSTLSTPF